MRRSTFTDQPVTYGAVGGTQAPDLLYYPPKGYKPLERQVRLGSGEERFETAAAALAWSVLALSIGAISLLFVLIRHGAATKVSSLMYLTPTTTAVMAWLLFGETLSPLSAAGMVVAALGVALVIERRTAPAAAVS